MLKVLIVDDERMEREFMSSLLQEKYPRDIEVKTASNGREALEQALLWQADIVFMDIEMPLMSGIEASKSIRKSLPECKIVFLTAYSSFDYAKEGIQLKVVDYLLKPVEDQVIIEMMDGILGRGKSNNDIVKNATDSSPIEIMEEYIATYFYMDISLDSIAEKLNFSPYYLSKLFKQHYNTTFIDYLTNIRIEEARKMLTSTNKSIKEVGELVGYPNSTYFVKLFKKKMDMTPSEYRSRQYIG